MIERYDPFGRMLSLRQMMDRLLEDAVVMPRDDDTAAMGSAALDVYEEGDNLVVEAQMPGVRPEDIDLSVERGMLTIRAETEKDEERQERNYLIREHRQGSFLRRLRLPDTVDPDRVQANFENGVLRLVFPRSEQSKRRRIGVSSGGRQVQSSNGKRRQHEQGGEQDRSGQAASSGGRGESAPSGARSGDGGSTGAHSGQTTSSGSSSGGATSSGEQRGEAASSGARPSEGRS